VKTQLTLSTLVVSSLLVAGCDIETSPSALPEPSTAPARVELALASQSNLFNPGPVCTGARSPGFYCQKKDREHPEMDPAEFTMLADEAAATLSTVDAFASLAIGDAVCIRGNKLPEDQLLRQLATLALNLAANLISEDTAYTGAGFANVGEVLIEATAVANEMPADRETRNAIKDVLDEINNNVNTVLDEDCFTTEE